MYFFIVCCFFVHVLFLCSFTLKTVQYECLDKKSTIRNFIDRLYTREAVEERWKKIWRATLCQREGGWETFCSKKILSILS